MVRYEITVVGVVGPLVLRALDGFTAMPSGTGCSCLTGEVVDQAALLGVLNQLQDLSVRVLEVRCRS
jgi:hypothetical protein